MTETSGACASAFGMAIEQTAAAWGRGSHNRVFPGANSPVKFWNLTDTKSVPTPPNDRSSRVGVEGTGGKPRGENN